MSSYYDARYFDWQKNIGFFGGVANLQKFKKFISKNDVVVDFGSGGGYLLHNLECKTKIGIEINEQARKTARELGIKSVDSPKKIPANYADVIISNHALEHCERPLDELRSLKKILKPGGKIVFVLPHERDTKYTPSNISQHLYTWSEVSAGNIFAAAGYRIVSVETLHHTWPPYYTLLVKYFGMATFNWASYLYSYFNQSIRQVRVIAKK